jgi:hypothetical protein
MFQAGEAPAIACAGVHDPSAGAVVIVELAGVRLHEHAAARKPARHLDPPRHSGMPAPAVATTRTASGVPGATRRVRAEMTPPKASDP